MNNTEMYLIIRINHFQQQLVNSNGYPFEEHEVSSEDGYILSLHRIPKGKFENTTNKLRRPIALFQHGLLASSDVFLFRGPDYDLRKFSASLLSNKRLKFYYKSIGNVF